MHQLLQLHSTVQAASGHPCAVESFLGGGGQGKVYRALLDGKPLALKWYFFFDPGTGDIHICDNDNVREMRDDRARWRDPRCRTPGRSVTLVTGVKVNFGSVEGEIRI